MCQRFTYSISIYYQTASKSFNYMFEVMLSLTVIMYVSVEMCADDSGVNVLTSRSLCEKVLSVLSDLFINDDNQYKED